MVKVKTIEYRKKKILPHITEKWQPTGKIQLSSGLHYYIAKTILELLQKDGMVESKPINRAIYWRTTKSI